MKKKMVKIMEEECGATLAMDPKMETFGKSKAEEIALLDVKFSHNSLDYEVKVQCSTTLCQECYFKNC